MTEEQTKLQINFKKHKFKPIIFDGNKYKSHIEAFMNNDFKALETEETAHYQESFDQYALLSESIFQSNQLIKQNVKFVVPFYHLNTYDYSLYQHYHSTYEDELQVMINFFISLFENFGDKLIYKKTEQLNNQISILEENPEFFFDNILFEDYLGNISLNGQPLSYYFHLITEKKLSTLKIQEVIKYKNF